MDQRPREKALVLLLLVCGCEFSHSETRLRKGRSLPDPVAVDASNQTTMCAGDEFVSTNGHCCIKCHPGYKLKKECDAQGRRSSCEPCSPGTYLEKSNWARTCFRCKRCKEDEIEISPCQKDRNTECACKENYYRYNIDMFTWHCEICRTCKPLEKVVTPCGQNSNTVCDCKEGYYRLSHGHCELCRSWEDHSMCHHLNTSHTSATPPPGRLVTRPLLQDFKMPFIVLASVVASVVALAGMAFFVQKMAKGSSSSSLIDKDGTAEQRLMKYEKQITNQEKMCPDVEAVPANPPSSLPDCVPCEFNVSQFIYFIMELVPADRFKELMRRLDVSERELERAERDNHTFREGQYQMLRVWSETGSKGVVGTLSRARLLEMVDTMRNMGLASCAENVEDKYGIQ